VAQHEVLRADAIERGYRYMLNLLPQAARRQTNQLSKARGE
jgi:hypothetical protein